MKNASETKNETPEEIAEHIGRLMSEAESLLAGPVTERVGEKWGELRSRFENIQSKAGAVYGEARKKVVAGARVTDDTIRTHPYESLAVALGVGVVLGALIRRGAD